MKQLNIYKIITWLLSGVITAVFLWHGGTLIFAIPGSYTWGHFSNYGLTSWMVPMGLWEVVVGALFLMPQTSRAGYLLAMIHWGGMFFLHLSQGEPVVLILYLMMLTTGINYIRNPHMFKLTANKENNKQKETKKYKRARNQTET